MPFGLVWQGARYEGLVTVFLEYLGAFGGKILDEEGRVVLDSNAAVTALTTMRDEIAVDRIVPPAVLTWQEEQVRFAFQNGQAAFMRNWPYAYGLLMDASQSRRRQIRGCVDAWRRRRRANLGARRVRPGDQRVQRRSGGSLSINRLPAPAGAVARARAPGRPVSAAAHTSPTTRRKR